MHSLKSYRKKYKITQHELAKMLKVHTNHLSAIEIGSRTPSTRLCRLIEEVTGGEVTFNDLIPPASHIDRPASVMSEKVSREG